MDNNSSSTHKHILQKKLFMGAIIFIFLLIVLFVWATATGQTTKQNKGASPSPSITQPTPLTFDEINQIAQPSSTSLSLAEQGYTEAGSQIFPDANTSATGTLVVTSIPDDVRVTIETSTNEAGDGTVVYGNYTPFKWKNIQEGTYHYIATKENYDMSEGTIIIKEGLVTRLNLRLIPLQ